MAYTAVDAVVVVGVREADQGTAGLGHAAAPNRAAFFAVVGWKRSGGGERCLRFMDVLNYEEEEGNVNCYMGGLY